MLRASLGIWWEMEPSTPFPKGKKEVYLAHPDTKSLEKLNCLCISFNPKKKPKTLKSGYA